MTGWGCDSGDTALLDGLRVLGAVVDELTAAPDLDSLARRAVELARSRLGIERCALFLRDGADVVGTYGTDLRGRTTDERDFREPIEGTWDEVFDAPWEEGWRVREEVRASVVGGAAVPGSRGWGAYTQVRRQGQVLGVFCSDAAVTDAPFDPLRQHLLALLAAYLVPLLQHHQAALERAAFGAVGHRLAGCHSAVEAAEAVVAEAARLFRCRRCCVAVLAPGGDELEVLAALPARRTPWPRAAWPASVADLLGGLSLTWTDGLTGAPLPDDPAAPEPRAGVAVPIQLEGQVQGFLTVACDCPERYGLDDADNLNRLADLLGASLARNAALEARAATDRRFRAMFYSSGVGMLICSLDGTIVEANTRLGELLGYPPDELIGRSLVQLTTEADRPAARRRFADNRTGLDTPRVVERRWLRRDGSELPVRLATSLVRDPEGRPAWGIGMVEDITAEKAAEAELARRSRLLEAAARASAELALHPRLEDGVNQALAILGEAAGADRAYLFQNHTAPDTGALLMSQRYEWARAGVTPQLGNLELQNLPYDLHPSWWLERLQAGEAVSVVVRRLEAPLRDLIAAQGTRSLTVVPIHLRGQFWGFIGLDSCSSERVWTEADGAILSTAASTIGAVVERALTAEALRRSEARHRSFLQHFVGIAFSGPWDGPPVFVQGAFEALTGYQPEDLTAGRMAWLDLVAPEDRDPFTTARDAWRHSAEETFEHEHRLLRRDGELRWVRLHMSRQPAEDGEQVQGAVYDITDSKRAEAALRASEERVRAMLDALPDMVLRIRQDETIVDCGVPDVGPLAVDGERLVGRSMADVLPREAVDLGRQYLRATFASRSLQVVECPLGIGGERRWYEARMAPCGPDEVLVVVRDVTEQRRVEEQLRQASKMEAVGQLAGGVAHDFNNLLTAILGYTDMLEDSLPQGDSRRGDLGAIRRAGEQAAALTQQLLAFSRQQVLQPTAVDVAHSVAEMLDMLRRMLGEDVELAFEVERRPLTVVADPHQLQQVVLNLAVNARDAMPTGGRLGIRLSELDPLRAEAPPGLEPRPHVVIEVSDTGMGMDDATRQRIFEPFFTTKGMGKGTGLGLATVYGIVRQSGGQIKVDSHPGLGTTFRVYLPAPAEATPQPAAPQAPRVLARPSHETVLLVEDEEPVRTLVSRALDAYGYRVLTAASGEEALVVERGHAGPLALLLTDVVLPGLNGVDLARQIEARRPGLRVLFISGYADDAVSRYGLAAPIAFLQKPFSPRTLAEAIQRVLQPATDEDEGVA